VLVRRVSADAFDVECSGPKELSTRVTVLIRTKTTPSIGLVLNTWKYPYHKDSTPEEYKESQRFFYDCHTCPTNWLRDVVEVFFKGEKDPHNSLFQFVEVTDGHWVDPADVGNYVNGIEVTPETEVNRLMKLTDGQ
jgi:hypothetical protein